MSGIDTAAVQTRVYRSIFLEDGWAHQKYFGWTVVEDLPGLRILQKRRAVFTRSLILLTRGGCDRLAEAVVRTAGRAGLSDIMVHDFDEVYELAPEIAGSTFRRAEQRERLLNIATFAVDLRRSESEILAAMSSDYRRKIKKAPSAGIVVEAHPHPDAAMREVFFSAYASFAGVRGLKAPDPAAINAMYAAGDALLLVARKDGEISNYLHVYVAGETGVFMHGVNLSKLNDGAGQFLHWQAMRALKARGLGWYDLGGIAALDTTDGIYNFKKKFGGQLVRLGTEWRYTGAVLRRAFSAKVAIGLLAGARGRS